MERLICLILVLMLCGCSVAKHVKLCVVDKKHGIEYNVGNGEVNITILK